MTWGAADLGCYGQQRIRTPHSDRLAKQGMRFTAAYAGGSVCAPSRSVLMTGLHLGHTPVRANALTEPLDDSDVTVAEMLRAAGYATGGFGKWGLGEADGSGAPTRQGFDEFFGYLHQVHAHTYWPEYLWDGDSKFPLPANAAGKMGTYSADVIAERMYGFVRKNRDRPFFLYATPTLPHALYHPPDVGDYSGEPWSDSQKKYASMVSRADAQLGRILTLLDEYGLAENTIVICTSDNGGPSRSPADDAFFRTNGELRGYKGSLWEGGLRVPMIVRWPGRVAAEAVNATPCYFTDFFPTTCAIAGAKAPKWLDGESWLPVWAGKPARPRFLYWEQERWSAKTKGMLPGTLEQASRWDRWKAIRRPKEKTQLFDLVADPGESQDVAAAHPDLVNKFERFWSTCRVEARPHNRGREWH